MKDDEAPAIRITQQFRSGEAMVYDFRGTSGRLTVRITGRGGEQDGPPSEWRIEASTGSSPESVVVACFELSWTVAAAAGLLSDIA